MRFSCVTAVSLAAAGALLSPSWNAAAQDGVPGAEAAAAPVAEAAAAPSATEACPPQIEPDFLAGLGQPGARLDSEEAVYAPAGTTALGHPVSYLIVTGPGENDAADAPVRRLAYRLSGVNTRWGVGYAADLRTAFDKAFDTKACGDGEASCMVDFRGAEAGQRSGAELSNRAPSSPRGPNEGVLRLVRADYNLDGADPVYLVCHYATD